jgi:hypothetical protein
MPRIRTLKPEFWDSPDTARADLAVRLAFMAMWNWSDDSGRGTANLKELEAFAFPNDDVKELPRKRRGNSAHEAGGWRNFAEICGEVTEAYGVVFYRVKGRPYYCIPSFKRHQSRDFRPTSKHPPLEDGEVFDVTSGNAIRSGVSGEPDSEASAQGRGNSAHEAGDAASGTGEQGNRGTGEEETCAPQAERETAPVPSLLPDPQRAPEPGSDDDPDWLKFWAVYPRKKSKEGARASWRKAIKKADPAVIIAGAERYASEREGADPQYTSHPTKWLNQGCWADEADPPPSNVVAIRGNDRMSEKHAMLQRAMERARALDAIEEGSA